MFTTVNFDVFNFNYLQQIKSVTTKSFFNKENAISFLFAVFAAAVVRTIITQRRERPR